MMLLVWVFLTGWSNRCLAQLPAREPSAADISTARDLFNKGVSLALDNRLQEALDAYERSYALRPSNLTRYSIAAVQQRMGKLVEAQQSLHEFVASEHDSTTQQYVPIARKTIRQLDRQIGKLKVRIPSDIQDTRLWIDRERIPPAAIGLYRPVNPGKRHVQVRAAGYKPFNEHVIIKPGESIELQATLVAEQSSQVDERTPEPVKQSPARPKTAAIALTITGGAATSAGLAMTIVGAVKHRKSEDSDKSGYETMTIAGAVSLGVGVLCVGIGTYLFLAPTKKAAISSNESNTASHFTLAPFAASHAGGLAAIGTF